jgi:hypothetical protein
VIAALPLAASLLFANASAPGRDVADGCAFVLDDAERTKVDALARELREAEEQSAKRPSEGASALRDALEHASADAILVAKSQSAREAQRYARLALARSLLASGDREAAAGLLDEMLAIAGDTPLPAKLFGPAVSELHAERAALSVERERGEVVIECEASCVAIASDTLLGCASASRPLHLQLPSGPWRITVAATDEPSHRAVSELELSAAAPARVRLGPPADRVDPPRDHGPRKLPRWAGILGMSVGAAAMIVGGVLVGVDGKCPDLKTDPTGPDACGRRLNTDVPGIVMLATGGAVFTGFTIAFGIGEARQTKARRARATRADQARNRSSSPGSQ